jgi:hypothetical protein
LQDLQITLEIQSSPSNANITSAYANDQAKTAIEEALKDKNSAFAKKYISFEKIKK